jgi:DNA-binding response OmpR family regulator
MKDATGTGDNPASILLVEDEVKIAASLKQGLEEHNYAVTVARDGIEAMSAFHAATPDLIILDLNLPRKDGYTVCQEVRLHNKDLPIMMLTAYSGTENKIKGFEAGADQYLEKPFVFAELLVRIKALLRRAGPVRTVVIDPVLRLADLELNQRTREVTRGGKPIHLTPKEFSLLEYFLSNPFRVLSRAEIALHVWKIDFNTHTNITDVYINFLRKKIDKGFDRPLLHTYPGIGYALTDAGQMLPPA